MGEVKFDNEERIFLLRSAAFPSPPVRGWRLTK